MAGQRELWEVTRFSGGRRGFQPQCDCYRTEDPPALHIMLELPGVDPAAVQVVARGTALVVGSPRAAVSGRRPVSPDRDRVRRLRTADRACRERGRRRSDRDVRGRDVATRGPAHAMNEMEFTETAPTQIEELPAELPVLPLKDTVVFPDSMTPLAIGQERSIRLVDDVIGGERVLA